MINFQKRLEYILFYYKEIIFINVYNKNILKIQKNNPVYCFTLGFSFYKYLAIASVFLVLLSFGLNDSLFWKNFKESIEARCLVNSFNSGSFSLSHYTFLICNFSNTYKLPKDFPNISTYCFVNSWVPLILPLNLRLITLNYFKAVKPLAISLSC